MPTPRLSGSTGVHRQSKTWKYDPQSGVTYCENWASFSERAAWALRNAFCQAGVSNDFDIEHGKYILRTQDTRGQYFLDTWQLQQNELQVSSLKNPRHFKHPTDSRLDGAVPISDNALEDIAAMMNGTGAGTLDQLKEALAAAGETAALRLLERMQRGETHFARSGCVLRHTTNCPAEAQGWNVADTWVDCIYSFDELLAECSDASLWVKPIPTRLAVKLNTLSADLGPAATNYQWGWLKRASTESTAADNRVDISTEYWLDEWSLDVYRQCTTLDFQAN